MSTPVVAVDPDAPLAPGWRLYRWCDRFGIPPSIEADFWWAARVAGMDTEGKTILWFRPADALDRRGDPETFPLKVGAEREVWGLVFRWWPDVVHLNRRLVDLPPDERRVKVQELAVHELTHAHLAHLGLSTEQSETRARLAWAKARYRR